MITPIVFVGEAWGEKEAQYKHPFVGPSGVELYSMLREAGFPCEHLPYSQFVSPYRMTKLWSDFPHPLLNVFNERPEGNKVDLFFAMLRDNAEIERSIKPRRMGSANGYVRKEFAHHIHKLYADLESLKPNLIVALGATACWALGLSTSIGKIRGTIHNTPFGKVLPIYHPASILRKWEQRVTSIIDFVKAKREMSSPITHPTERIIWTEPTIEDLYTWWEDYGSKCSLLSVDIETIRNCQISEVGFASSPTMALHVPFLIEFPRNHFTRFFKTLEEEVEAWRFVKMVCESDVPKVGHNMKYDAYYLIKETGIAVRNWAEDTMQMMHVWQPEWQKSLGFLGSVFLNEESWKHIRSDAKGE